MTRLHPSASLVAFVVSLAILSLEVFYTRLFSVILWENNAFAILACAFFGLGASGVLVYLTPRWFSTERPEPALGWLMATFGPSILASYLLLQGLAETRPFLLMAISATIPFFWGGTALAHLFASYSTRIAQLYFSDLVGAALGAFVVLPMLWWLDGPPLLMALAIMVSACGVVYAMLERQRPAAIFSAVMTVGMLGMAAGPFALDLELAWVKGQPESNVIDRRWGPEARISVIQRGGHPWLVLDGGVVTPVLPFDGTPSSADFLQSNVNQLVYQFRDHESAVILGPGGGSDVLAAVNAGVEDITAVEVNRAIVDLMTRPPLSEVSGGLYDRPEVDILLRDGRGFVATMDRQVDVIQATFIDTYTASSSGNHALSENYIYTTEAFESYLEHVHEDGVVSFSRWAADEEGARQDNRGVELHRLVATAVAGLRKIGVEHPTEHVVAVLGVEEQTLDLPGYQWKEGGSIGQMATVLIRRTPFPPEELASLEAHVATHGFEVLWMNGRGSDDTLRALLSEPLDEVVTAYLDRTGLDISPVTDDQPFFFNVVTPTMYLRELVQGVVEEGRWGRKPVHRSEVGMARLWAVLLTLSGLVATLILLPLTARLADIRALSAPVSTLAYFASLGVGFIGLELGFIHAFGVFLEHPIYSMVVVVTAMLLFTGLGSLWTARVPSGRSDETAQYMILAVGTLVLLYAWLMPAIVHGLLAWPFAAKAAVAVALIAPLGFVLGTLFPLGVASLRQESPGAVPWMWGLNAGLSVMGAPLAMVITLTSGYTVAWLCFGAAYAVAFGALWARTRG